MAKKKKTRQEKIKADLRHQLPQAPVYVVSQPTEKVQAGTPIYIESSTLSTHSYFARDLQKTIFLTLSVLAGQIVLFYFLQNHVIKLPFITY
jgi:hypothetical protein